MTYDVHFLNVTTRAVTLVSVFLISVTFVVKIVSLYEVRCSLSYFRVARRLFRGLFLTFVTFVVCLVVVSKLLRRSSSVLWAFFWSHDIPFLTV